MPAVQCLRGMNSPANGIFFPRPASLIGGMTRQATQGGRPRARPPPVHPKGGARRGGSKVRERCKRATGRSPLKTGSEQGGRPLLARKRERVWEATGRHVPQGRRRRGCAWHCTTHRGAPVPPRRERCPAPPLRRTTGAPHAARHDRDRDAVTVPSGAVCVLPPARGFDVSANSGVQFSGLSRCAGQLSGGCCTVPHAPRRQRSRKLRNNNRLRPNSGGANPPLRVRYCAR